MEMFIQQIFLFPTVFFTGLLTLVLLYWLSTILGAFGIDVLDGETELEAGPSGFAAWLSRFKLDGIPLTITLSFIILASWIISFLVVYFTHHLLPQGWVQVVIGIWLILLIPVLAAVIVSPFLQPLKPLFRKTDDFSYKDRIGMQVIIRTGYVNESFGEAELADGGAGLLLKVRASEPNSYKRGDKAILRAYEASTNTYRIN